MLQKGESYNKNSDTIMITDIAVKPKRLFGFNTIEHKTNTNGKVNDFSNGKKLDEQQQPKYVGVSLLLLAFVIVFGKLLLYMGMYENEKWIKKYFLKIFHLIEFFN